MVKNGGGNKPQSYSSSNGQYISNRLISYITHMLIESHKDIDSLYKKVLTDNRLNMQLKESKHYLQRIKERNIPLEYIIDSLVDPIYVEFNENNQSKNLVGRCVIICVSMETHKIRTVIPTKAKILKKWGYYYG